MLARIVCQVLQRPDRVTFVWSQDDATFAPYHLDAAATAQFYEAAGRTREQLAKLLAGADCKEALARAGHDLYQLIFAAEPARKVQQWLKGLENVASFDLVTDAPGRIPWHAVCEQGSADVQAFWGMRYPITAGRRVNPLRLDPFVAVPDVLLVFDAALSAEQRQPWQSKNEAGRTVGTRAELKAALRARCPDLLGWVGGFAGGELTLGGEAVSLNELRGWIEDAEEGSTEPLFLLHPVGQETGWHHFLMRAALSFPGLITWEAPSSTPTRSASEEPLTNAAFAGAVLEKLRTGGAPLAQILRDLRRKEGWLGLGVAAFCPPEVFFGDMSPDADVKPRIFGKLPAEPFHPLASLDGPERPLLGGRDRDVFRCASLLDEQDASLLFLHGGASVGKTSFVRAGLVPFLENDAPGYLALRDRTELSGPNERAGPVVSVRASRDLAGQLAAALCFFCERSYRFSSPTQEEISVPLPQILWQALHGAVPSTAVQSGAPKTAVSPVSQEGIQQSPGTVPAAAEGDVVVPPDLWEAFEADPTLLGQVLDGVTRDLPHDLVILVEQGEDIFTQAREEADEERRARALKMLLLAAARAPRCKIILSLRSDFLGQPRGELSAASADSQTRAGYREFFLPELTRAQLIETLLLSTATEPIMYTGEVPFNKYKFAWQETFADELVDEVSAQAEKARQSPIALLQVVAEQMYQQRVQKRGIKTLGKVDLKTTGGVEDAVGKSVDKKLNSLALPRPVRGRLRKLLTGFSACHADGTITRDSFSIDEVEHAWSGRKAETEKAVTAAEGAGLVELQQLMIGGKEETYASLPQDSIARVVQDWNDFKKTEKYAWTKIVDQWFIALPLVMLAAVIGWKVTEYRNRPELEKRDKAMAQLEDQVIGVQLPKYVADMSRAETAWQSGSMDVLRRVLTAHQRRHDEFPELRGFEWYHLWHLANSERLAFKGHSSTVAAVAVSPDGKVCATTSLAKERGDRLFLWDLTTGKKRATLYVDADLEALTFSSDGKYLVAADGKALHLWDAEAGKDQYAIVDKPKRSLTDKALTGTILALTVPRIVLTGAIDKDFKEIKKKVNEPKKDSKDPKQLSDTEEKQLAEILAAFKKIPGGWTDAELKQYESWFRRDANPEDRSAQIKVIKAHFAPSYLVSAGADKTVILWDLSKDEKNVVHSLAKHTGPVQTLAFAGTGKLPKLASGDSAGKVILWDLADADPAKKAQSYNVASGPVRSLVFSADGKKLLAGGVEPTTEFGPGETLGFIRVLDLDTLKPEQTDKNEPGKDKGAGKDKTESGKDNPDKAKAEPAKEDPARREKFTGVAARHGNEVFSLALSPDGKVLASGGLDNFVRLWDAATLKEIGPIKGHIGAVRCLAFTPDGDSVVSGSFDGTAKVWRPARSENCETLLTDGGFMTTLDISGDGKLLAAGGKQGKVYLWNVATGKRLDVIDLKRPVVSVAFNHIDPEERMPADKVKANRLAVGILDPKHEEGDEIQIWEFSMGKDTKEKEKDKDDKNKAKDDKEKAKDDKEKNKDDKERNKDDEFARTMYYSKRVPAGQGVRLASLALSSDGQWLAYNSGNDVGLFDLDKKEAGAPLKGHDKPVLRLAISPDGKTLAAGALDGKTRVWFLAGGELPGSPLKGHDKPILSLIYPDSELICTSGADRNTKLCFVEKDGKIAEQNFRNGGAGVAATSLVFIPRQGQMQIVLGGADNSIRIVTLRTQRLVRFFPQPQIEVYSLRGHTGPVRALALTPFMADFQALASTGDDGSVRLWRAATQVKE